jgi:cytochrome P450
MSRARSDDVLTADDPLYRELYDVRREGEILGNLVERDMNPALNALRERGPVQKGFLRELLGLPIYHRHELVAGKQGYTALSYDACEAALRDHEHFSSRIVHKPNSDNEETMAILEMDGGRHRAFRRTLQPKFIEPQAVSWWRERWIDGIVAALIERLQGQDAAELNQDFCARIPVHTITLALGLEGEVSLLFRAAMFKAMGAGAKTPEEQQANAALIETMLLDLFARRRAEPRDDLASFLVTSQLRLPDGTVRMLTDREAMHHARLVMVAGGGTTSRQMAILLWALLTHPDQLDHLRRDRSLMKQAIDEAVRWNATAPLFNRLVVEDIELCGVALPAGAALEVCLGAANRDPARWDNPDAFDIHRPVRGHLGFGIGQHRCLGMNVAHCEMAVGLTALLDAFPNLRLDPDAPAPFMTGGFESRSVSALPVLL